MWDDKYSDIRDTREKAHAYWAWKLQRCLTRRNNNNRSNGSVSVSREGAANKEVARPSYRTQDHGSGDGLLNGALYTLC